MPVRAAKRATSPPSTRRPALRRSRFTCAVVLIGWSCPASYTRSVSTALEVTDLAKSFGAVHALSGLSLQVRPATVTALLGPNGAGKTTTIEICVGLQSADSGTARVLGLDPHRDRAALRARIGVMPQAA